jgi:hypothetical protein
MLLWCRQLTCGPGAEKRQRNSVHVVSAKRACGGCLRLRWHACMCGINPYALAEDNRGRLENLELTTASQSMCHAGFESTLLRPSCLHAWSRHAHARVTPCHSAECLMHWSSPPALTLMCFVISVTRDSLSKALSSMPPIWLYTNKLDSNTASEKICVLYWLVCKHQREGHIRECYGDKKLRHMGQV